MLYKNHLDIIDRKRAEIEIIADAIWDTPETSFEEYKSSALLVEKLRENGFTVTVGVSGIPTALCQISHVRRSLKHMNLSNFKNQHLTKNKSEMIVALFVKQKRKARNVGFLLVKTIFAIVIHPFFCYN